MANEFKIKKGLIVTGASGGTVVDIQGSQGQLFSVTDDLSGSIFAVSDISGVPILDVNSSGLVTVDGPFTQTGGGDSNFSGDIILQSATPKISLIDTDAGDSFSVNNFTGNFVIKNDTDNVEPLIINGANNATFAGNVGSVGLDVQRTSGSSNDILRITSADVATTIQRIENTGDAANGYGKIEFKTNAATGQASGRGGFKFIDGDSNDILYLDNDNAAATFTGQGFSSATSSGDGSSTLTTKGYVDGLITGATIYRGAWDPSGGGYGSPDLSGVTQTSGYYYICSAAGTAEPNGTGTEPDTWETGDWVIYNDVSGTGQWQKIDNSSVLSGVGTGQTVALWEGAGSVTDSETLGNAPITVSGSDTTFAQDITARIGNFKSPDASSSILMNLMANDGSNAATFRTTATGKVFEIKSQNSGTLKFDSTSSTFTGDVVINSAGDATSPILSLNNSSSNTFNHALEAINDNLTAAQTELLLFGKETNNRNSGFIGYNWNADNSDTNYVTIGHWGYNHLLKIYPTGTATFVGAVTSPTFLGDLNGTINTATTGATQTAGDNSTLIATTAYADAAAAAVPIGNYLPLAGGTLTGNLEISGADLLFAADGSGDGFQMDYFDTKMYLGKKDGSSWHMVMQDNGNVGIGTDSPVATLTVDGGQGVYVRNTSGGKLVFDDESIADASKPMSHIRGVAGALIFSTANRNALGNTTSSIETMRILNNGNVGIGTTSSLYKLDVSGSIRAGGKLTYEKSAGSLDTTGYAVAGLLAGNNGNSCMFTFTAIGNTGHYQKVVYSCWNAAGTWNTSKVIDEGTNGLDIEASTNASTITFTFKSRSGSLNYTPRVTVEASGSAINSTYA